MPPIKIFHSKNERKKEKDAPSPNIIYIYTRGFDVSSITGENKNKMEGKTVG